MDVKKAKIIGIIVIILAVIYLIMCVVFKNFNPIDWFIIAKKGIEGITPSVQKIVF